MGRPQLNNCSYKKPNGNSLWRRPKDVNIYLMRLGSTDIYKIGYTSNSVEQRLSSVKYYHNDVTIIDYVLCDFKFEKLLHEKFKSKKVDNGFREFFRLDNSDLNYMKDFFKNRKHGSTN